MAKTITTKFCIDESKKREYEFLDISYINNYDKMNFKHLICNNSFKMNWRDFHNKKRGCPFCGGTKKLTLDLCKQECEKRGYIFLSKKYINCSEKVKLRHIKCGYVFNATWNNFYNAKTECRKCSGLLKLTLKDCKKNAIEKGYILKEKQYKNSTEKMRFIHNTKECKFEFMMAWHSFRSGNGCPLCASKQSESKLASELKEHCKKIYNSISEYRECVNPKTKKFLPYDIYFKYNNCNYYIEVNGDQHYRRNLNYHRTEESFKYQKYKDKIKKKHANKNGVFIEIDMRTTKKFDDALLIIENHINLNGGTK